MNCSAACKNASVIYDSNLVSHISLFVSFPFGREGSPVSTDNVQSSSILKEVLPGRLVVQHYISERFCCAPVYHIVSLHRRELLTVLKAEQMRSMSA
jgi:hypothetical protein